METSPLAAQTCNRAFSWPSLPPKGHTPSPPANARGAPARNTQTFRECQKATSTTTPGRFASRDQRCTDANNNHTGKGITYITPPPVTRSLQIRPSPPHHRRQRAFTEVSRKEEPLLSKKRKKTLIAYSTPLSFLPHPRHHTRHT